MAFIFDKTMDKAISFIKDGISNNIIESIKGYLETLYMNAWHDGRRYYREKLSKNNWLIINPEKQVELQEKISKCPCDNCKCATTDLKIGCLLGKLNCEEYQEYLDLCEFNEYFNKH